MVRLRSFRGALAQQIDDAWWNAWVGLWDLVAIETLKTSKPTSIDEYLDRRFELSQLRNAERELDADQIGDRGGDAEGAGTGGQD